MPRIVRCDMGRFVIQTLNIAALGGIFAGAATAGTEESPVVPSGQVLYLQETLYETRSDQSRTLRLRYVMPAIAEAALGYGELEDDFPVLCEAAALSALEQSGETVQQVIISLADRETPFGEPAPETIQFFEAFRIENGACIWEGF